jgi:hypothetical protein
VPVEESTSARKGSLKARLLGFEGRGGGLFQQGSEGGGQAGSIGTQEAGDIHR